MVFELPDFDYYTFTSQNFTVHTVAGFQVRVIHVQYVGQYPITASVLIPVDFEAELTDDPQLVFDLLTQSLLKYGNGK